MRILVLIMLIASGFVAADLYLPSLPAISADLHASVKSAQETLFVYLLGFSLSQLIAGTVSDRFGRKPVVLIGLVIYLVGCLISLFANSADKLVLARLVQGLGIGSAVSLGRVMVRDLFQGDRLLRVLSYLSGIIGLSLALAPALGGYLQHRFGYIGNLWFMLLYGVVVIALVIYTLPETNKSKDLKALQPKQLISGVKDLFSHRSFVVHSLSAGLAIGVIIGFSALNPFLLEQYLHVNAYHYGLFALLISFGMAVGMFTTPHIRSYIPPTYLILLAFILMTFSGVALLVCAELGRLSVAIIVPTCMASAFSAGIIMPNSAVAAFQAYPKKRGILGSVYSCIITLVASVVGFAVSWLHPSSLFPLSFLFIGLGLIGCLLRVYLIRAEYNRFVTSAF